MNAMKLLMTALAAVGMASGSAVGQSPVVIKFAGAFAPTSITNQETIPAFIKAVEAAAAGTIKIEYYPGGTLGPNPTAQIQGQGLPPLAVIFALVLMYILLGCVFDALAGMVLTLPFVVPIVAELGYDLVWWGIVNVMVIEIGMITPPIGINVFVIKGLLPDIPLGTIFRGITPFLIANVAALLLVLLFPQIATWLPDALR